MKLEDVIERFGSRADMARWCRIPIDATYKWHRDDAGNLTSPQVRDRVIAGLVRMMFSQAKAEGREVPEADARLLEHDLKGL